MTPKILIESINSIFTINCLIGTNTPSESTENAPKIHKYKRKWLKMLSGVSILNDVNPVINISVNIQNKTTPNQSIMFRCNEPSAL